MEENDPTLNWPGQKRTWLQLSAYFPVNPGYFFFRTFPPFFTETTFLFLAAGAAAP